MSSRLPATVGIDVGSSSVKIAVCAVEGGVVATEAASLADGATLRDGTTDAWALTVDVAEATRRCVSTAEELGYEVRAVGLASACPSPVVATAEGSPRSPVGGYDQWEGHHALGQAIETVGGPEALRSLTGNQPVLAMGSAASLRTQWEHGGRPEDARLTHLAGYLCWALTGAWVMDWTHAAYTGLMSVAEPGVWDDRLLEAFGLERSVMATLVPPWEEGLVTEGATARAFGLPAGVPVTPGSADTACAALAAGCTEPGSMFESMGTSAVLSVCTEVAPGPTSGMVRPHVLPGRWLVHYATSGGLAAARWAAGVLHATDPHEAIPVLEASSLRSTPGSHGAVFLPSLSGERSPTFRLSARGAWLGLHEETTTDDLGRAVLESGGHALRQALECKRREVGEPAGTAQGALPSVGGGAHGQRWAQLRADIATKPLALQPDEHVGARGAAMVASRLVGAPGPARTAPQDEEGMTILSPKVDTAVSAIYDQRFATYEHAQEALGALLDTS